MQGRFYRLKSPFADSESAWIVVSEDRREALAGYYRMAKTPNGPWKRLYLAGLEKSGKYMIEGKEEQIFGGDELMSRDGYLGSGSLRGRRRLQFSCLLSAADLKGI